MKNISYKIFAVLLLLIAQACKKDKLNFESDNRATTVNRANSTARIVNLAGYGQVIANGDTLTGFVVRNPQSPNAGDLPGTPYFPATGTMGKTWFVPQDLFNISGSLELDLSTKNYQGLGDQDLKFQVSNSYTNPTDYYILPTTWMNGQPDVVPLKREIAAPSKPDHFKIRIVNLSGEIKSKGFNYNGALEDLTGNVSLAYANGDLVDAKTSNISNTTKASEYIELPYGTYQFKVLMQDGRQMPALGSEIYETTVIDPATSIIPAGPSRLTALTYAPIQTYQPGGIYTIVIAPQSFRYLINEMSETSSTYQNSFQILTDNSAPVNNTYFRMQAVNAFQAANFSFRIDGKPFNEAIPYSTAGTYGIHIQGQHKIEALDASGKVVATADQMFRAGQNYTAWLYADAAAAAKLLILANDLSGANYNGQGGEDGTFSRYQYRYFFQDRFLNLSADNAYVTFTHDNGATVSEQGDNANAGVNFQPGVPLLERPNVFKPFHKLPYQIMAYRSKPGVVPGVWAQDIQPLKSEDFVAKKSLYENANRNVPAHEPGIYTVALIGQSGAGATSPLKAKMIIVKHNK